MSTREDRITELELRHTDMERLLEQLNQVIIEQGTTLDKLRSELARLDAAMRIGNESESGDEPPPPHY